VMPYLKARLAFDDGAATTLDWQIA
jgi:hypothetical protein